METGNDQHFVPKQMIRRFANQDGTLLELYKPSLQVFTGMRRPKGILKKYRYYKDAFGDIDAEWLTPIEQRFQKHYPALADYDQPPTIADREVSEALVDWSVAQLCRTELLARLTHVAIKASVGPQKAGDVQCFTNILRQQFFQHMKEICTSPGWRWRWLNVRASHNIVLTDHPVCSTSALAAHGPVLLVPISRKRMLFGGSCEALDQSRTLTLLQINCFLAAWADRSVFAADSATLHAVAAELRGEGTIRDAEFLHTARQPLFGNPAWAEKTEAGACACGSLSFVK